MVVGNKLSEPRLQNLVSRGSLPEGRHGGVVNPKGRAGRTLEEHRYIKVLIAGRQAEAVINFGCRRIADGHSIDFIDDVVTVDILILNVSRHIFSEILTG